MHYQGDGARGKIGAGSYPCGVDGTLSALILSSRTSIIIQEAPPFFPHGWDIEAQGSDLSNVLNPVDARARIRTEAGQEFRKFPPLLDRVLVERSAAKTVTKGHIMLPEKPQGKARYMTIVAVGSGSKGKCGGIQPVSMKVGDKFLLPKYGGTKVVLDNKDYFLLRDRDILRKHID
ncbi:10 kDa heat shock protein, mitochondrial-like [Mustela nigripes]|uniref:10 kDa heat shock protein, mitochondrial-like n=1 Tax=Mustela nigripes TaxID=77151 RepID=UPI0028167297|nr:10 kDa heat shock protein, mitochondrial-like [Mustela nigripes]